MDVTSSVRVKQSQVVCKILKIKQLKICARNCRRVGGDLFVFDLLAVKGYPTLLFAPHPID
jgi:hypothetical protein